MNLQTHKAWYSRGYLPHFDHPATVQFITFHLADSLPRHVLESLQERAKLTTQSNLELRRSIEKYLDAGHGDCWLQDERIAKIVEQALFYFDNTRYRLLAWVIMPNHLHVLIEMFVGFPLSNIIRSWKTFTAREVNTLLKRTGQFWQREYFDRFIRDADHFEQMVWYIHQNPVKAGLVHYAEEYRFSSAHGEQRYPIHTTFGNADFWSAVWSWERQPPAGFLKSRPEVGAPKTYCTVISTRRLRA